jgi:hypothetical protein
VKFNDSFKLTQNSIIRKNSKIINNDISGKRLTITSLKDQNAFVFPLAISIFTMVPFLIYQQALKPKERTVKQIELDAQLRPKDKKLSSGKTGSATAQGKKK